MKTNILFVGSFKSQAKDGSVGGQMFACNSLLRSDESKNYNFILIDSTADSVPAPHIAIRFYKAILRLLKICLKLTVKRIDVFFVFSSAGFSFKEKGITVMLGRALGKKVFFFPRSGLIKDDVSQSKFNRWFATQVIRNSHYVICQGDMWKNFYKTMDPTKGEKFVVMQNWIDIEPYQQTKVVINTRPIIIYLGWLEPYKGIIDLLEACHDLEHAGIQFEVHVYGAGSSERIIKQYVTEHRMEKYFQLKGWANMKQKLSALENADIFVLPSHREGFPNALLEAMASGVPSIGSNVGGVPDLIDHGVNGFMIEPGDKIQLKNYIEILLRDLELRKSFSQKARDKVSNRNSVKQAWKTLSSLINTDQ